MDRLDELRLRYSDSLPQKGRDLAALWNAWLAAPHGRVNLLGLHQQVHRISGSAPAYGFDRIGTLAQRVESVLAEWLDPRDATDRDPEQLRALMGNDMLALLGELSH
ncbi:MAG: Hpt domain-containing protein [Tahibacter sp.]